MTAIAMDTSAIVEVLTNGPLATTVRRTMDAADTVFVMSVTRVEAALVMLGRFGWTRSEFDRSWQSLGLDEVAADMAMGNHAIDAFETWGKGRSAAALNFGDCFSYALAASRDLPLLFAGDDFAATDLVRPEPPAGT